MWSFAKISSKSTLTSRNQHGNPCLSWSFHHHNQKRWKLSAWPASVSVHNSEDLSWTLNTSILIKKGAAVPLLPKEIKESSFILLDSAELLSLQHWKHLNKQHHSVPQQLHCVRLEGPPASCKNCPVNHWCLAILHQRHVSQTLPTESEK